MGQRANYIIKENNNLTIYYHHWRALNIAADLYLGEKRFLEFVKSCKKTDDIMNIVWLEGCVIIDKPAREICFWSWHFPTQSSVIEYYLSALALKWEGWKIRFHENQMYDSEKVLGINYISEQELPEINKWSEERIINDKPEEWTNALLVIKEPDNLFVTMTGNLGIETVISYGKEIIPLIKNKQVCDLPEEESDPCECLIIDTTSGNIYINTSIYGLWEQCKELWKGYSFKMGNVGYVAALRLAGIDTSAIKMSQDAITEQFRHIVSDKQDNFDPNEFAAKFLENNDNVQFNPNFFDNVKPQKSIYERLKTGVRKIFKK